MRAGPGAYVNGATSYGFARAHSDGYDIPYTDPNRDWRTARDRYAYLVAAAYSDGYRAADSFAD